MGKKAIPTRIIEPPWKADGTRGKQVFYVKTDVGEYALQDLEEITGINYNTLYYRIKRFGWARPDIFAERIEGGIARKSQSDDALLALSGRSRAYKLKRMALGSWELEQLQGAAA